MTLSITCCIRRKYLPQASSLAASIRNAFGIDAELIEGDNGVFDVVADGDLIFSKHAEERFLEHDEIIAALRARGAT